MKYNTAATDKYRSLFIIPPNYIANTGGGGGVGGGYPDGGIENIECALSPIIVSKLGKY